MQRINWLTPFRATIVHASVLEGDEEKVYEKLEKMGYKEFGERKTHQQIDSHKKVISSKWKRYDSPRDPYHLSYAQFQTWFNEKLDEV